MNRTILVLASHAPSFLGFRRPLIQELVARGHTVTVAAPGLADQALAKKVGGLGVRPLTYHLCRTGLNVVSDLRTLLSLFLLLRREKPDFVVAYTIKPVVYGLIAAKAAGIHRRVALITGLGYAFTGDAVGKRAIVRKISTLLYRVALRHASVVIFQNRDDERLFSEAGITKGTKTVVVAGSGVDLLEFPRAQLPENDRVTFLLVARLLSSKGIREYAEAASIRRALGSRARFLLVGAHDVNPDAIPSTEINAWVRDGTLEWLGHFDDVRPHLAACDAFVLPSYREGTPRSTLEALATGRAVITTDVPGCRETVMDGVNGFLVPPRDGKALAVKMKALEEDPSLVREMGQASLRLAHERFDVRKVNLETIAAMSLQGGQ